MGQTTKEQRQYQQSQHYRTGQTTLLHEDLQQPHPKTKHSLQQIKPMPLYTRYSRSTTNWHGADKNSQRSTTLPFLQHTHHSSNSNRNRNRNSNSNAMCNTTFLITTERVDVLPRVVRPAPGISKKNQLMHHSKYCAVSCGEPRRSWHHPMQQQGMCAGQTAPKVRVRWPSVSQ